MEFLQPGAFRSCHRIGRWLFIRGFNSWTAAKQKRVGVEDIDDGDVDDNETLCG